MKGREDRKRETNVEWKGKKKGRKENEEERPKKKKS